MWPHRRPPLPVPPGADRVLHPQLGHRLGPSGLRLAGHQDPAGPVGHLRTRAAAGPAHHPARSGWAAWLWISRCWSSSWWWTSSSRCSAEQARGRRPVDGRMVCGNFRRQSRSAPMSAASMASMDASQSALDSLRTVEFRETLKGYHRDDVDEYLEKAAVEAEGLQEQLRQSGERLRQAAERISQLETALEQQPAPQPASRPSRPSPTTRCSAP